jgi:hypothetical protein
MRIQSVLFDKNKYSRQQAIQWLEDHGFQHYKIDVTKRYYRFRQFNPNYKHRYRIKTITKGIKFIFEI